MHSSIPTSQVCPPCSPRPSHLKIRSITALSFVQREELFGTGDYDIEMPDAPDYSAPDGWRDVDSDEEEALRTLPPGEEGLYHSNEGKEATFERIFENCRPGCVARAFLYMHLYLPTCAYPWKIVAWTSGGAHSACSRWSTPGMCKCLSSLKRTCSSNMKEPSIRMMLLIHGLSTSLDLKVCSQHMSQMAEIHRLHRSREASPFCSYRRRHAHKPDAYAPWVPRSESGKGLAGISHPALRNLPANSSCLSALQHRGSLHDAHEPSSSMWPSPNQVYSPMYNLLLQGPRRPALAERLSAAYDAYLEIMRRVDARADAAMGRDNAWHIKNVCAPCLYKVNNEAPLRFSWLGCMDGNSSLKLVDATFRSGATRPDNRSSTSFRWLSPEQVNVFKDEVAESQKAQKVRIVQSDKYIF
jgi:hypothetical protein